MNETHSATISDWFLSISDICMIDKTICGNGTCHRGASGHYCVCHAGFTNYGYNESRCTGKDAGALIFFHHTLLNRCLLSHGFSVTDFFLSLRGTSASQCVCVIVISKQTCFLSIKLWRIQGHRRLESGNSTQEAILSQFHLNLKLLLPPTWVSFSSNTLS